MFRITYLNSSNIHSVLSKLHLENMYILTMSTNNNIIIIFNRFREKLRRILFNRPMWYLEGKEDRMIDLSMMIILNIMDHGDCLEKIGWLCWESKGHLWHLKLCWDLKKLFMLLEYIIMQRILMWVQVESTTSKIIVSVSLY